MHLSITPLRLNHYPLSTFHGALAIVFYFLSFTAEPKPMICTTAPSELRQLPESDNPNLSEVYGSSSQSNGEYSPGSLQSVLDDH